MVTSMETLPVRLTETELLERGHSLALEREDVNRMRIEAKANAAKAKDDIETAEAEIDRLAAIVRDKAEPRPVETKQSRDYTRFVVDTIRLDTGELVRTRTMTEQERQVRIWPEDEAPEAQRFEEPVSGAVKRAAKSLVDSLPDGSTLTIKAAGQEPVVIDKRIKQARA